MAPQKSTMLICEPAREEQNTNGTTESVRTLAEHVALHRRDLNSEHLLIAALLRLAGALLGLGQLRNAEGSLVEVERRLRRRAEHGDGAAETQLTHVQIQLGFLLCSLSDPEAASRHLSEAVDRLRSTNVDDRTFVAALNGEASAFAMLGKHADAIESLQQAATIAERISTGSRAAPDAAQWAMLLNNLGRALLEAGDISSSRSAMLRCIAVTQELVRFADTDDSRNLHAAATCRLGSVHEAAGDFAAAESCYVESVADMRHLVEERKLSQFAGDYSHVTERLARLRAQRG
jgi:tetratricopeptide (TPR) repeat protein